MRTITAMTGANNMDITWHYPVNLIWWYVPIFYPIPASPIPFPFPFPTAPPKQFTN